MTSGLLGPKGKPIHDDDSGAVSAGRLTFSLGQLVQIVLTAIGWGGLLVWVAVNTREIDRLRDAEKLRMQSDVSLASNMATKKDIERVSDQLTAVLLELQKGGR